MLRWYDMHMNILSIISDNLMFYRSAAFKILFQIIQLPNYMILRYYSCTLNEYSYLLGTFSFYYPNSDIKSKQKWIFWKLITSFCHAFLSMKKYLENVVGILIKDDHQIKTMGKFMCLISFYHSLISSTFSILFLNRLMNIGIRRINQM